MRQLVVASMCALLSIAAGCQAPDTTPAVPHGTIAAPPPTFHDMSRDQQVAFMKDEVLPAMKAAFTGFDKEEFAAMNCATCHGAGAKDKTFKMPNPSLPPLPADPAGFAKLAEEEPEAMKFMAETVVPRMAALLGEKPYDPATHTGFGCFECHTMKK